MKVHYVGTAILETLVDGKRIDTFGDAVELDTAIAEGYMRNGIPLLPSGRFDAIGFTPEELKQFGNPGTHAEAPESFLAKRKRAWIQLNEIQNGEPLVLKGVNDGRNTLAK